MENLRGALLMTLAMALFALTDVFTKQVAHDLPIGQIIAVFGVCGALSFATMIIWRRQRLWSSSFFHPAVILRNLGEIAGTTGVVCAIALTPLASATAIMQSAPLVVTAGAALFFGEKVGWRRWMAIVVGFLAVLLILRPGLEAFDPLSLFAVLAAVGLAIRDLGTRAAPDRISSIQLAFYGLIVLIPLGGVVLLIDGPARPFTAQSATLMGAGTVSAIMGYYAITAAMRVGEISATTPFRYTRLIFAFVLAMVVFGERPDLPTILGGALVILTGLYTIFRERRSSAA